MESPRFYFPYIDTARAVAVTLVLVCHLAMGWESFPSTGVLKIFRIGWIGVDLFFVISGFVISLSLIRCIEKFGINNYKQPYFKNRLSRIVPLYFLTSWCYLVLVSPQYFKNSIGKILSNILSHAFFIHNFSLNYITALNPPAWSLAVEMQFYIFMAIVFKWFPIRRPLLVCSLFIMTALAWRAGVWYTFDSSLDTTPVMILRALQLPGSLDEFGLGCVIALIMRDRQHLLHKYLQPNWKNSILWFTAVVFLWVITWKIFLAPIPSWDFSVDTYWKSSGMVIFFKLFLAFVFASWVCFLISLRENPFLTWILSPISYIGKISYGIYLWHALPLIAIGGIAYPGRAVLITLVTLVIASFTWHFFERPLISKYHDKPSSAA